MESGLYSIGMIKNMIFRQNKLVLYYSQYDPYDNLVEIEFSIETINEEGLVAILNRYYTRGKIQNVIGAQYYLIPFKDYRYISKKSQYL